MLPILLKDPNSRPVLHSDHSLGVCLCELMPLGSNLDARLIWSSFQTRIDKTECATITAESEPGLQTKPV